MGKRDLEQLLLLGHLPWSHLLLHHPLAPLSCRGCTRCGFWDIRLFYGMQLELGASTERWAARTSSGGPGSPWRGR